MDSVTILIQSAKCVAGGLQGPIEFHNPDLAQIFMRVLSGEFQPYLFVEAAQALGISPAGIVTAKAIVLACLGAPA